MIALYDECEYENVSYNEEYDSYYIKNDSNKVIEKVKNSENALENIKSTILDKNIAEHIFIDPETKKVFKQASIIIYTTKESDLPCYVLYLSSMYDARAAYNRYLEDLKSDSQFIDIKYIK